MWSVNLALKALLTFSLTVDNSTKPTTHELRRREVGYIRGQTNYPIPDSHIILKYDDFDYSKKDVPIPPGLLLSGCDEVLIEIGKLMNAHNLDWKFLEGSEKGSDVEKGVFRSSQDLHIRIFPNRDGETITLTEAYDCVEGIKAAATDPKYGYTDEAWINLVNDGVGFGAITMYCDKDLWSKCFNKVVA